MASEVKTIGQSGQISLGKEYAGRTVLVEELEPGVWLVRTAQVVPDNERWLHAGTVPERLDEALGWAARHPVAESDLDALEQHVRDASG